MFMFLGTDFTYWVLSKFIPKFEFLGRIIGLKKMELVALRKSRQASNSEKFVKILRSENKTDGFELDRKINAGRTSKTQDELEAYLTSIAAEHQSYHYKLLDNNCRNYSQKIIDFLFPRSFQAIEAKRNGIIPEVFNKKI